MTATDDRLDEILEYSSAALVGGVGVMLVGLVLMAVLYGLWMLSPIASVVALALLLIGALLGIYVVKLDRSQ